MCVRGLRIPPRYYPQLLFKGGVYFAQSSQLCGYYLRVATIQARCLKYSNWILTSVLEVYGVWNLATNYPGAYFQSFLQTSSLLQAQIQAEVMLDCVKETLYSTNINAHEWICKWVYEQYLLTYLPSNCNKGYYSKWLHFFSPHATRPMKVFGTKGHTKVTLKISHPPPRRVYQ